MAAHVETEQTLYEDTLPLPTTGPINARVLLVGRDNAIFNAVTLTDPVPLWDRPTQPLPVIGRRVQKRYPVQMFWWAAGFVSAGMLSLWLHRDTWFAAGELIGLVCIGLWLVDMGIYFFRCRQ